MTLESGRRTIRTGALELRADESDPRWRLALRIAESRSLGRSKLLSDFLLYIVDRYICERTADITEYQIGVLVFGRSEGYDPGDDNIVRSYARNLRRRIDDYFANEGREEILRLEVPRGGYTPIFTEVAGGNLFPEQAPPTSLPYTYICAAEAPQNDPINADIQSDSEFPLHRNPPYVGWLAQSLACLVKTSHLILLIIGLLLGIGLGAALFRQKISLSREETNNDALWKQLFNGSHDTFIVPSDVGLVILQGLIPDPVSLTSYVDGSYRAQAPPAGTWGVEKLQELSTRRYTSVADLEFVAHVSQIKEVVPERMMIRYAHDLRMDDLRSSNAILIGATEANPWVELFQPQLHFRFRREEGLDKRLVIVNTKPRPGEKSVYDHIGESHTYGIIAYLPNLSSTGHILIIAGLNSAGTQAAGSLVLNQRDMSSILERATVGGVIRPFEVLLEADNVATTASTPHIILERIGTTPQE